MEFIQLAQIGLTLIILGILAYASKEDIKHTTISKRNVMLILIFTLLYTLVHQTYGIERTVSFVIAFGLFGGMSVLSRGKFGFGDSIIISSLALYIGTTHALASFFTILGFTALAWGGICILNTQSKNKDKTMKQLLRDSLHAIETIPIENALPGMILYDDYFMEGLTEHGIIELKKRGITSIKVKRAYPFIPAIFISFVLYLIFIQYHLF